MQKRTVKRLLFSSAMLALALPLGALAEDGTTESPRIQITLVNGKPYMTNAPEPNPPLPISALTTAAPVATQSLDRRMPAEIQSLVHDISKTHGVDPQLVAAVMKVESDYNPRAISSAGALGLMQLMPATGKRFGVSEFFDPRQNIEGGVKYLRFLSDKFGPSNIDLITAAYNAGENRVERIGRRVPRIPETVDYVRKVGTIYKPSVAPALVSATVDAKPVVEIVAPEPPPAKIYKYVDERGVTHFSNIGPPR
jgi:hypothetical protein